MQNEVVCFTMVSIRLLFKYEYNKKRKTISISILLKFGGTRFLPGFDIPDPAATELAKTKHYAYKGWLTRCAEVILIWPNELNMMISFWSIQTQKEALKKTIYGLLKNANIIT